LPPAPPVVRQHAVVILSNHAVACCAFDIISCHCLSRHAAASQYRHCYRHHHVLLFTQHIFAAGNEQAMRQRTRARRRRPIMVTLLNASLLTNVLPPGRRHRSPDRFDSCSLRQARQVGGGVYQNEARFATPPRARAISAAASKQKVRI